MPFPPDSELLDFDANRLADYDPARSEELLRSEHGDLFRNHLVMALWIDGWRERADETYGRDEKWSDGADYSLREIVAHLRQGDFMPDSFFFRETVGDLT